MPFEIKPALTFLLSKKGRDLSVRQLSVMIECKDGQQTVRGLSEKLNLSKPAITRAADRLESEGILARTPDPSDRRSVFLALTTPGKKFAANFS
jgi:DNA-binding MarR family transcriptional regulator